MLFNLDGETPRRDAHEVEFRVWRSQISDGDYRAMVDAINAYCDRCEEYFCASWMPGQDSGIDAAFAPLQVACGGSQEQSSFFFGNIVWRVICDRDDDWCFRPADKESEGPLGMWYFRRR